MNQKLEALKLKLKEKKIDSLFISNYYSIFYLSGYKGVSPEEREGYLIFDGEILHLLAPRLYQEEAKALESKDLKVHFSSERNTLMSLIESNLHGRIGFEGEDLKYLEYKKIKAELKGKKFVSVINLVSELRQIKTEEEISILRQAQEITYKSIEKVIPFIKPGVTEKEVSEKLKQSMFELGAQGESFETIVASGSGSALPHYHTSNKKLQAGEMILIDVGAKYKGYCGDTTRMVFLGTPTERMVEIYELVQKAQQAGIKAIKNGVKEEKVFDAAINIFKQNNVSEHFIHGLGHGVGLAVHEYPYIRPQTNSKIQSGMVFSVEPGLYFKDWGGVRIEDLVVCREKEAEILGNYTKEMVIL